MDSPRFSIENLTSLKREVEVELQATICYKVVILALADIFGLGVESRLERLVSNLLP